MAPVSAVYVRRSISVPIDAGQSEATGCCSVGSEAERGQTSGGDPETDGLACLIRAPVGLLRGDEPLLDQSLTDQRLSGHSEPSCPLTS